MRLKKTLGILILALIVLVIGFYFILTHLGVEPGEYRVVVGPPGNTYADPEFYKEEEKEEETIPVSELPEAVAEQLKILVPDFGETFIGKDERDEGVIWLIKTSSIDGKFYFLQIWSDGRIGRITSGIDEIVETERRVFHRGKIQEISTDQVPKHVFESAKPFQSGLEFTKAYSVDAVGGHRYFVQFGSEKQGMIYSLNDDGEIRSAGRASLMIRPITLPKIETLEEIASNLSKYGDKYHVDKVIAKIQDVKLNPKKGFRFVVVGDSRSNLKVWQMVAQNINKRKPLFVINLGDMTRYGYSQNMDKYHFATLEEYANYFFLPIMGNHDCRRGGLSYEYVYGGPESRVYYFDYGNCRFIILDNCEGEDAVPWEEQIALADKWLSEKSDYHKFVFLHIPPPDVDKWAYHSMPPEMSAPFVKLMSKHEVDHVFMGHIHAYSTATYGGVDYTITGGGGAPLHTHYGKLGSVNNYVVVDVIKDKVKMKVVRFYPREKE